LRNPTVTSPDEQRNAENLLIAARHALKEATDTRMALTRPLDDSKARIILLFKPYTGQLEEGIAALNGALSTYRRHLQELQLAEQHRAMEEAAQALADGEVVEPVDALDVPDVKATSRTDMGTVTYREDWDVQIVDAALVPRDLCEPSLPRIRARVKSGVTTIPGVLITRRTISIARTQKGG